MVIRKSAVIQYFLIYLMLLIPGSCLYAKYLVSDAKYYFLIMFYVLLIVLRRKYRSKYILLFLGLLLSFTIFTRLLNGGAGITSWLQFALCILSTQIAISADIKQFLGRWIKLVTLFALISIIFWAVFCLFPNLVNMWPAANFFTQTLGTGDWATTYHGKGVLLYSYLEIHPTRNCGIYTEPGVYQIVLNSALCVLLFWRDKLHYKSFRQYLLNIFVIIIAIITCQSTTGYIAMIIILIFFYMSRQGVNYGFKVKKFLAIVVAIGILVLLLDYNARGTDSIMYIQIIEKLFGEQGMSIDVSRGSGQYRLGTILLGLSTIFRHPLGVGYDSFTAMMNSYGEGLVAASIIRFAAIFGLIPWIIIMVLVFKPLFKYERISFAILFVLLFVNTTLAQTDLFYPALMMFPFYLYLMHVFRFDKAEHACTMGDIIDE